MRRAVMVSKVDPKGLYEPQSRGFDTTRGQERNRKSCGWNQDDVDAVERALLCCTPRARKIRLVLICGRIHHVL